MCVHVWAALVTLLHVGSCWFPEAMRGQGAASEKLIDFSAQVTYEKAAVKYCKCPPAILGMEHTKGKALGLCFLVDLEGQVLGGGNGCFSWNVCARVEW